MTLMTRRRSRLTEFPTRVKFITLSFALFCLWSYWVRPSFFAPPASTFSVEGSPLPTRQTLSNDEENCNVSDFERNGGVVLYFLGILYVFLGLAIICDEYFVSSLEVISEVLHLSEDVAGATFMAAGSSAPEFFTSMADAFIARNGIGIGTIIGSAIFNILVIVGVTGAAAGRVLDLDGWPLGRDAVFYAIAIISMSLCYWNGRVEWWEALCLVLCYCVYILFMKFNSSLRDRFKPLSAKEEKVEGEDTDAEEAVVVGHEMKEIEKVPDEQEPEAVPPPSQSPTFLHPETSANRHSVSSMVGKRFPWHRETSFRDMRVPGEEEDVADVADVDDVDDVDADAVDGTPKVDQGRRMMTIPSDDEDEEEDDDLAQAEGEGKKDAKEPYEDEGTVDEGDVNIAIPLEDLEEKSLESPSNDEDLKGGESQSQTEIAIEKEKEGEEEEEEHRPWYVLNWPDTTLERFMVVVSAPLIYLFRLTVPDCRRERWKKYYVLTFIMSIVYIGLFSHLMVDWASKAGCVLNVPAVVMGLLVLAAGTSIPDMLSSLSVAKEGHGDMAVSNAIGSNVFDILLGLGFPWFLASLVYGEPFYVSTDNIIVYTALLFGILIVFILVIIGYGWKLHPIVGWIFLIMYGIFFVVSVLNVFVFHLF